MVFISFRLVGNTFLAYLEGITGILRKLGFWPGQQNWISVISKIGKIGNCGAFCLSLQTGQLLVNLDLTPLRSIFFRKTSNFADFWALFPINTPFLAIFDPL